MKRFVSADTRRAIESDRDETLKLRTVLTEGPALEVFFPATNSLDVRHRLGIVPTGYVVLLQVGGSVEGIDVEKWTTDIAILKPSAAGVRARLYFVATEEPII